MELDQLRTLLAVLDSGSFEAAARSLSVTPSAVSQRIKSLETQSGRVLLQRTKPIAATMSGEVVTRLARQVDLLEREATAALSPAESGLVAMPLVINADSLATWALPALASVEGVAFDIRVEDQDHSTALLRDGSVMAAVTSDPEPVQGCTVSPLGAMRYSAVANPEFSARWFPEGPRPSALNAAPIVQFDRRDAMQDRYLRKRTERVLTPPRHFVPASDDFVRAVTLGFGWAMVPQLQTADLIADGRLVELDSAHPIDVRLHWQQWSLDSATLVAVADAIHRAARLTLR